MNQIFVVGGSVVLLFGLIFGVYSFMSGDKADDLATQKNKLQNSLSIAEKKLKKQKETLDTMTEELKRSFHLAVSVQDQMRISSDIVKETDFMFTNPDSLNPELILKNLENGILINNERKDINLLLLEWQEKIDLLSVEEIDLEESEKIKKDIETIKKFIEDLLELVSGLTPGNSGISQFQIDIYETQLPSIDQINEVLVSIETVIENYKEGSNSGVGDNDPSSTDPSPNTPPVTPDDLVIQEKIIEQTETEIEDLQEELTDVEEEIQQLNPITPIPTPIVTPPAPTDPIVNPDTENQGNNGTINTPRRIIIPSQPIIVQPGKPRLIQGTDPY